MNENMKSVATRLAATCKDAGRLVFWQDEAGTYRETLSEISVEGIEIFDATGAELACKRRVLIDEPHARFVIYRAGVEPIAVEDIIYDLKLRAKPFTCNEEGLWAEACGVPVELAATLADHAAFFKSKARINALAKSELPKETVRDLEFAMAAATLGISDGTKRDVARAMAARIVAEASRAKDDGLRALATGGLVTSLWHALEDELGYHVPQGMQPNPQDLAFRLVEGSLGDLVDDPSHMSHGEACRVLATLLASARTKDAFDAIVTQHGWAAFDKIPQDKRSIKAISTIEYLPQADEWMLKRLANQVVQGQGDLKRIEELASVRASFPCSEAYVHHYGALVGLCGLEDELSRYWQKSPAATTMSTLLEGYASSWYKVDRRYREAHLHMSHIAGGHFASMLSQVLGTLEDRYDQYLSDCATKWQEHLLDAGMWPASTLPSQADFFREHIAVRVPEANFGHRVGVIVSDALRYECAADFVERLRASKVKGIAGKTKVALEARVGMVPSYTQLGMAALLPTGTMEIDPATANVNKDGASTTGTEARLSLIEQAVPGTVVWQADALPPDLAKATATTPVVWVYHNVIDRVGDKLATERKTFSAVEDALVELEHIVARLSTIGCGTILVTADHGFIYQDRDLSQGDFADVEGLSLLKGAEGIDSERGRRFVVSDVLPKDEYLIEYSSSMLSLAGGYLVGVPRGVLRFRLSGSGARFVHGGVSPQELVVPVVTVASVASKNAAHPSDVSAFVVGRQVITGPTVAIDVYQAEPIGEDVTPVTVRVGAYSADGSVLSSSEPMLELDSTSPNSDDRKRRVRLTLTDDVDDVGVCLVRVARRMGSTNSFKIAWEREYRIQRYAKDF